MILARFGHSAFKSPINHTARIDKKAGWSFSRTVSHMASPRKTDPHKTNARKTGKRKTGTQKTYKGIPAPLTLRAAAEWVRPRNSSKRFAHTEGVAAV